jgi:hypothetical protein
MQQDLPFHQKDDIHIENEVFTDPFYHFKGNMLFSSKYGFMG